MIGANIHLIPSLKTKGVIVMDMSEDTEKHCYQKSNTSITS